MSDSEPPDTLRENDKPNESDVDIGAVVVRNIVREEVEPLTEAVKKSANDVLAAIHEANQNLAGVNEQLKWLVSAVKDNRTDIDKNAENIQRIMSHLGLDEQATQ